MSCARKLYYEFTIVLKIAYPPRPPSRTPNGSDLQPGWSQVSYVGESPSDNSAGGTNISNVANASNNSSILTASTDTSAASHNESKHNSNNHKGTNNNVESTKQDEGLTKNSKRAQLARSTSSSDAEVESSCKVILNNKNVVRS